MSVQLNWDLITFLIKGITIDCVIESVLSQP